MTDFMEIATSDLWELVADEDHATTPNGSSSTSDGDGDGDANDDDGRELARKRRAARYRDKRREELLTLRQDHVELQARLVSLLWSSERDRLKPTGGWRGTAMRQLRRRVRSEVLNRDLRSQVVRMQVAVRQLEQACLALRAQAPSPLVRRPSDPMPQVVVTPMDVSRVVSMAQELDAMYAHTDAVLSGCERPTTTSQPCTWEVHRRWDAHQDREYVEMLESRAVPFPLQEAVTASHHALMTMLSKENPVTKLHSQELGDAVAIKMLILDSDEGQPVEHVCLWVGRVFMEVGRVVFCWQSVSLDDVPNGPEFLEHGWAAARPFKDASTSSNGTKFVFCTRYSMTAEIAAEHGRQFEMFADFVTQQPQQEASEWLEAVEDAVFDGVGTMKVN